MPDDHGEIPVPGDDTMAAAVDATIDKVLDQSFSLKHQNWMSQAQREDHAAGFLAEVTRLTFGAAASMQVQLAGGILAQRSAQQQPQVGVIPSASPISVFNGEAKPT